MTDVVKITTARLGFTSTASSKRVFLGYSNNYRQSEMAAKTGNTHTISELYGASITVWDSTTWRRWERPTLT